MTPEQLLEQINRLVQAYAKAETCRAMSQVAHLDTERAHMQARAEYWDAQVSDRHAALTLAINSALPPTVYAGPDPRGPIRLPNDHEVEVRGNIGTGGRQVSISLTAAQAVAIGTTLIACGAVSTDRLGAEFGAILPPIPASPNVTPF